MVEVSFSSSFKRAFKKRIKGNVDLETRFWQKLGSSQTILSTKA
jgi:hypothetical protein